MKLSDNTTEIFPTTRGSYTCHKYLRVPVGWSYVAIRRSNYRAEDSFFWGYFYNVPRPPRVKFDNDNYRYIIFLDKMIWINRQMRHTDRLSARMKVQTAMRRKLTREFTRSR